MSGRLAADVDRAIETLVRRLEDFKVGDDHWEGSLASSALSTGTAVLALHLAAAGGHARAGDLRRRVASGAAWLVEHQNGDGGWGDTVRSRSNISTTAIVWAALSAVAPAEPYPGLTPETAAEGERCQSPDYDQTAELKVVGDNSPPAETAKGVRPGSWCGWRLRRQEAVATAIAGADDWLERTAGGRSPEALREAILRRYGKDQTFSVPILTVLALAGRLGPEPRAAWRTVPQLPFELAALPHGWFHRLSLPVVSYALPALIAIGQVRHAHAPSRNPATRTLRHAVRERTHAVLNDMQPASGGYLEATPLTSFVVMSLAGMGRGDSPVLDNGVRFLLESMRADGSWPIDTNLATWVTTLSIGALADAETLARQNRSALRSWLLRQQSTREHPFTHAAPGAWAWTPLSGGVPDADDTSGALLALRALGEPGPSDVAAASAGVRWLLGLQNRDGGIPTFCRGWGTLPFDRSTPELTAHALRAWSAWCPYLDVSLVHQVRRAAVRALSYLVRTQHSDGSWIPLWFGNEHASDQENRAYGTARTLEGLESDLVREDARAVACRRAATAWILGAQNADGGWGGDRGVPASIEETGIVLSALSVATQDDPTVTAALERAAAWLAAATNDSPPAASPIGLYFARLWYYEDLYPIVFALAGLGRFRRGRALSPSP